MRWKGFLGRKRCQLNVALSMTESWSEEFVLTFRPSVTKSHPEMRMPAEMVKHMARM